MKRLAFAALGAIITLAVCTTGVRAAAGGDDYPILDMPLQGGTARELPFHFYGVTLGQDWQGFPANLMPDYNLAGGANLLDVTLPVYIDWEMHVTIGVQGNECPEVTPQSVFPARPLANEPWFVGHHNELIVWEIRQDVSDAEYHTCAQGNGLELPTLSDFGESPFTADGRLRVQDIHGGIGNSTLVWGFRPVQDQAGRFTAFYIFIFRWNKVDSYTDEVTQDLVDAIPGTAVRRRFGFIMRNSYGTVCQRDMWSSMLAVQWPSTDIAGSSPRYTDATDYAHFLDSRCFGNPVVWGFDDQGGQTNRNYECNVQPFGSSSLFIDSSDFAVMNYKLGVNHCGLSKPMPADVKAAILAWFGVEATGRMIEAGPNGEMLPEYAIVDQVKCQRAIADPYGYLRDLDATTAVEQLEWGQVKQRYR
jgi:hypothetical protein